MPRLAAAMYFVYILCICVVLCVPGGEAVGRSTLLVHAYTYYSMFHLPWLVCRSGKPNEGSLPSVVTLTLSGEWKTPRTVKAFTALPRTFPITE